jgi:hypothetical protein
VVGKGQRSDIVEVQAGRFPKQVQRTGTYLEPFQVDLAAVGLPQHPGPGQKHVRLLATVEQPVGHHLHGQALRKPPEHGLAGGPLGLLLGCCQVHQQHPG